MNGAVGIAKSKSKLGRAVKVGSVYGYLSTERNGSGGKDRTERKSHDKGKSPKSQKRRLEK